MAGKNGGLLSKMLLSEVKMPMKFKIVLFLGFWMLILGVFWQHFWATLVPTIFAFHQKWLMPLEIEMNITLFRRMDATTTTIEGNQQDSVRFSEVGPYTFRQETINEEYVRHYVIRPRFDEHLRKKFYCIANCASLHNDTIHRINFENLKPKDGVTYWDSSSTMSFMWSQEKALDFIFSPLNLQLVSLASNIDIFDKETADFHDDRTYVAFNATGICRTVALFSDRKSENIDGFYGAHFGHRIRNSFYLSCRGTELPIHASSVEISVFVEPLFNLIISATYDVQFNLLIQPGQKESSRFLLPLARIHQKGSMDTDVKKYLHYHTFVIILSEHYCSKILLILGLIMIIGSLICFWKFAKVESLKNHPQMQELENFTYRQVQSTEN